MRTKSSSMIYTQRERVFRTYTQRAQRLARAAHPDTNGEELLVHNWGNAAARAIWARAWESLRAISEAADRLYDLADHRDHHSATFRPLYCEHCAVSCSQYVPV